jgi:hypothetical protein
MAWLQVLLAILIAYEPVAAQQKLPPPPPSTQSTKKPVTVPTYTKIVPNVTTTQIISPGSVNLSNVSVKPVPPSGPIVLASQGGTNGACSTPIPATAIIQDCILGNTPFESNMVSLYLAIHGQPPSAASTIYQYGGLELRSDIRSFMWTYIEGVIKGDPSLRSPSDKAIFNWIQTAVQNNENAYFQAAVANYNSWAKDPCEFQLDAAAAKGFGISYDGAGYCGASLAGTFTPLPAPDLSYFKEVGQITAYDGKISQYDGTVTNAALTGGQLMLKTEQLNGKWASLGGLGVSIAAGALAGAIVNGSIQSILPFQFNGVNDWAVAGDNVPAGVEQGTTTSIEVGAEGSADTAELVEEGLSIGTTALGIIGAVTIVLVFVEIAAQATINFTQTVENQNAINKFIAAGPTTVDLSSMLGDSVGYQKVFETFIAATLPDTIQTQGNPVLPHPQGFAALRTQGAAASSNLAAGICNGNTDPSCDVFLTINNTFNTTSVSDHFNYTTWDPAYPCLTSFPNCGNAPFPQFGTSFNAYPFEFGFIQTVLTGVTNYTFFSPTIKYIDPNTGIRYIAELIDKGRFLVTKAPEDVQNSDFSCPADPIMGLTQSPGTQIPTQCRSFVMNTLNIFDALGSNTIVQIPQPPVFATPDAADFSIAAENSFVPQLDSTTQGLPCSIRTTGTLPPGYAYQNGALFLQVPSLAVPGTYPFNFVADCETLGLGTPFVNYSFGTSITTQAFTANVYEGASAGGSLSGSSSRPSSLVPKAVATSTNAAASTTSGLQFIYPTSSTDLTFTQGRSTTMTVVTNGGHGTTITAEANALPPGMTLTDNGDGTATVSGIPTAGGGSCSSACAITASDPGSASASLLLKDKVVAPVLPTIPATQSAEWKAAENNITAIDGSADSNGNPTNVPLSWSVVGTPPGWVNFTDHGDNMVNISGFPPVSTAGQTIPIKFQYSYGGKPGFTSPTFTLNVEVKPPVPVLRVNPSLLFEVGVPGSGVINSSTLSGQAGLGGTWQVKADLPAGLREAPGTTSLTISGTPENPGDFLIPIEFTDTAGTTVTRNVAMMITQPASLKNFPSRLVLFVGVPANFILPVTAGFPRNATHSPGDGLPSTTGTNLALNGNYSTTNGFTIFANGGALIFGGTPLAPAGPAGYPLTVSAQTVLSTGPVGAPVSQPFTLYVQPAGDVNLDGEVNCKDSDLIKAHFGAVIGQSNYLDLADPNRDGVVNIRDLAFVASHLPKGTVCQ